MIIVISLVLSVAAIGISLLALKYSKRQTQIMERQVNDQAQQQKSQDEWSAKFDAAVSAVQKLGPAWMATDQGQTNVYAVAFPRELRGRIERYLIEERSSRDIFRARQMDAGQFRLSPVRDTISQVLDCARKFKEDRPDEAKKLGL